MCIQKMVHLIRPIRPLIFVVNVFVLILTFNVISNNCTVSLAVSYIKDLVQFQVNMLSKCKN